MSRAIAHMRWELRLLLRNGEQILVMFLIPLALLIALQVTGIGPEPLPAVITVSIVATCFTSLAISTGFERRSGALRHAATTPLTRLELLVGKLLATGITALISIAGVSVVGVALGWRPVATWPWAVLIAVLGAAAFAALAVLIAGTLRAEAVLALANGIFLVLIVFGGVLIPASAMPAALGTIVSALPSAALADGMRATLVDGSMPLGSAAVLAIWTVAAALLARRFFRWD